MIRLAQLYTGGVGTEIVRRCAGHPRARAGRGDGARRRQGRARLGRRSWAVRRTASSPRSRSTTCSRRSPTPPSTPACRGTSSSSPRLLRAGVNVYTGIGGYYLPGPPEFELIDAAGRDGNASFSAGGNIPGLISDVWPLFVTGYTGRIRQIRARQRNDVSTYPSGVQIQSARHRPRRRPRSEEQSARSTAAGSGRSASPRRPVADGLGIELHRLVLSEKRIVLAPEDTVLPGSGLLIAKGHGRGARVDVVATSGDASSSRSPTSRPRSSASGRAGARTTTSRPGGSRSTANRPIVAHVRLAGRRGTGCVELAAERGAGDEHRPAPRRGAGRLRLRARLPGRHRRRRSPARLTALAGGVGRQSEWRSAAYPSR